jgi:UDP-galactopyranose mutase
MKLINNKSNSRKYANNWRLNNILLNDQRVTEEIKRFLEFNEKENRTYQNIRDKAKAVPRGMFIAMNAYIKRTERPQINDLILQVKLLENQEQAEPKTSRREIIKISAEINERENNNNNKKPI